MRSLGPAWGPEWLQPQAQCPPGLPQDSWKRVRSMAPSPAKQGLSSARRDLDAWSRRRGIRTKWQTHRGGVHPLLHSLRLWMTARKSWAVTDPDPVSPRSDWRVGMCERPGTCLEWQAWIGGIFQKEKEKKEALSSCLGNSPQQPPPPPVPLPPTQLHTHTQSPRNQSCCPAAACPVPAARLSAQVTLLPRGTSHSAPVLWALEGDWLSKRKVEMAQRRAVGLRESAIPRKT